MPGLAEFSPGDHVRVIDGTFTGMEGLVITRAQAKSLCETVGGEQPPVTASPGIVCVLLPIFERQVPVCLELRQLFGLAK
jgi:transcription antitermination factor NusG